MAADLHGQIALVTGAGRGIGRATALRLAQAGCDVALLARTEADLHAVAADVVAAGARALVLAGDVTDDARVETLLQHVAAAWGAISILVNSAGAAPPRAPHARTAVAQWDRALATGLRAPMLLCRLLLPAMLARAHGAVINITSVAARRPRPGEAAYAAVKAGLLAFTHSLFAEVRDHGIKVCAISPGYVDTGFVPPNRRVDRAKFLQAADVAETVLQALTGAAQLCATEITLEPQADPEHS